MSLSSSALAGVISFSFPRGFHSSEILVLAIGSARWASPVAARRLAVLTIGYAAAIAIASPLATGRYLVLLLPVAAVLCALWIMEDLARSERKAIRATVVLAIVATVGCGLAAQVAVLYSHRNASFSRIAERLRSAAGNANSIAGPIAFSLAFRDRGFVVTNVPPEFGEVEMTGG